MKMYKKKLHAAVCKIAQSFAISDIYLKMKLAKRCLHLPSQPCGVLPAQRLVALCVTHTVYSTVHEPMGVLVAVLLSSVLLYSVHICSVHHRAHCRIPCGVHFWGARARAVYPGVH